MADQHSQPRGQSEGSRDPIDTEALRCSFCGKRHAEVAAMVCGPTPETAICDQCVELCAEMLAEAAGSR